jgi:hypothetical protein
MRSTSQNTSQLRRKHTLTSIRMKIGNCSLYYSVIYLLIFLNKFFNFASFSCRLRNKYHPTNLGNVIERFATFLVYFCHLHDILAFLQCFFFNVPAILAITTI